MRDDSTTGVPALSVSHTSELSAARRDAIVALCTRAFGRDFGGLFDYLVASTHVLAVRDGALIGHACWAPRRLRPAGGAPLRCAYVDAVATDPAWQGCGVGSAVMRRLMREIRPYELGGLSTARAAFYERLGWERWRGPTAVRPGDGGDGLVPTPGETVLILRTPATPPLDTATLLIADWRAGRPW